MNVCKMDEVREKVNTYTSVGNSSEGEIGSQGKLLDLNLGGWSNKLTSIEHRLRARHYSNHSAHTN